MTEGGRSIQEMLNTSPLATWMNLMALAFCASIIYMKPLYLFNKSPFRRNEVAGDTEFHDTVMALG